MFLQIGVTVGKKVLKMSRNLDMSQSTTDVITKSIVTYLTAKAPIV